MSYTQPTEVEREEAQEVVRKIRANTIFHSDDDGTEFSFHMTTGQAIAEIIRIRADAVKAEREKYRRGCPNCEDGLFDEVSCGVGFCLSCGGVAILSDDQEAHRG
jgi:hypothetical protein